MNAPEPLPGPLATLAEEGIQRRYQKRALIISEGDVGYSLFILLEGTVRIYSRDERGRELDFGLLEAGTLFGEMALDGGTRTASVEAMSSCRCAEIRYATLRQRLAGDPDFAFFLVSTLIGRSRSAIESAKNLALKTVYQRVGELLERESVPDGPARVFLNMASQQGLANRVGASRDMISKILKDLSVGGYIRMDGKKIILLKRLPSGW